MTGCSAVSANARSAMAAAATVPAETFKNCRRDKNIRIPPQLFAELSASDTNTDRRSIA
jgi:hypothetical protein